MSSNQSPSVEPLATPAKPVSDAITRDSAETEKEQREEKLLGKTLNQSVSLTEQELAEYQERLAAAFVHQEHQCQQSADYVAL